MKTLEDIVIVGGGLVGLCAALALQQTDRRISVLESSDLAVVNADGLNARSIALSYSSVQIFKALGIWRSIKSRASAIRSIHVSAKQKWGVTRLHAGEYDLEALGYVIESSDLAGCVKAAVDQSEHIQLHSSAQIDSLDNAADQVGIKYRLTGASRTLSASIALIADGALSETRANLGIEHRTTDFAQSAIITNVMVSKPGSGVAYERFTENGPLAMLPLGSNRYSCIWTNDTATAASIASLQELEFIKTLQESFGFRLGFIEQAGARYSFPIQRTEALSLTRGRCILIGNAANALHPVAGQSFNLALRDIAGLNDLLTNQSLLQFDQQAVSNLTRSYELSRQQEQRRVIQFGDGLVNLFSNQLPLLDHARAASLALLDIMPVFKTQVAFIGMGLTFEGNRMLRGYR